jgi:uncharacterized membrane protein YphA (DoxX/SURF4 family)
MALSFGQGLALVRIGFGLYFLSQAISKLTTGWMTSPDTLVNNFLSRAVQGGAEPYYKPFLEGVVIPDGLLFSQLVALGELAVAISLILGLFTRLGALVVAWLTLNYMLMKGLLNNAGSIDRLYFLVAIVFILASAGLVWGLDGKLRDLFAGNALTRWIAGLSGPAPERAAASEA